VSPCKKLSIVIPCRNESRHIARVLDSLLANDLDPRTTEVLVIDGMSEDGTRDIVWDYSRRNPWIRLVDNPLRNKPAALNRGIQEAEGEIIMRLDAHTVYDRDYVPTLLQGLEQFQADNIGGVLQADPGRTFWQRVFGAIVPHPFATGNSCRTAFADEQPREAESVVFGCYRREVFEKIGLFNEKLLRTQDRELNARLKAAGGKIILYPAAKCTYVPRSNLWQYLRWTFDGAYWLFCARRFTDTKMLSRRNFVPPLFVLYLLLLPLAAWLPSGLGLIAVLPVLLYTLLVVSCSAQLAWGLKNALYFPLFCVVFPGTHLAYGWGALWGLLQSSVRRRELGAVPALPGRGVRSPAGSQRVAA
jgi:cellulose synthase/poly-beta-1,6-N-acetylglucosamine synthase-like glycosyltransferase